MGGTSAMRHVRAAVLGTTLMLGLMPLAAHAGSGTDVALGLASFAVFNQVFAPLFAPRPVYAVPVVAPPPVVYSPYPLVYTYPPVYTVPSQVVVTAPMPTVVQYPHGRYELRGDGVTIPYQWVWIPNPPPPPPTAA